MHQILKNIPILYGFFLLIGYINLASYYSNFSISILEFTEISEMLLSFLGVTAYLAAAILFISFSQAVALFVPDFPKGSRRRPMHKKVAVKAKSRIRKVFNFVFSAIFTQRNSLIMLCAFFSIVIMRRSTPLYENLGLICLLEIFLAFLILVTLPYKIFHVLSLLIAGTYLIAIVAFNNQVIYYQHLAGKPIRNAEFKVGKAIIKSDHETIYVGMTKNYLFLYNLKLKKANIFDRAKISDLGISSANPLIIKF